ncbi:hypothetical protein GLOTRDRAFT_131416 [Gloeophyllum trabeum ATCC 11539]|uniref:Uncharacterized protein n=1 Tax=Gloeophyllum trabeum (strain ATCC 11539 / FP-39264 / Madison 617) TaxID=670483 RepID=S7PZN7_GLOTA|nr:uncharacterized protein GLOTRDRAFT_131416 [Gloeophyllum trabeum ATCC 11539]EPQ53131.1 hypothetical protein GLOTRDRAFT_131416 [Gloeophyllum trabeum ATCC 11539]
MTRDARDADWRAGAGDIRPERSTISLDTELAKTAPQVAWIGRGVNRPGTPRPAPPSSPTHPRSQATAKNLITHGALSALCRAAALVGAADTVFFCVGSDAAVGRAGRCSSTAGRCTRAGVGSVATPDDRQLAAVPAADQILPCTTGVIVGNTLALNMVEALAGPVDVVRKDARHMLALAEATGTRLRNIENVDLHVEAVQKHTNRKW